MNVRVFPAKLRGRAEPVITSKSQTHRALICAALADGQTVLRRAALSGDILATRACLEALGAGICATGGDWTISPIKQPRRGVLLDCGESGATLRFLLPVAAALGADGVFMGRGRLGERPLLPLYNAMAAHGVALSAPGVFPLACQGQLTPGDYRVAGGVSSQFVSGLLLALPLLRGDSRVTVTGKMTSRPYVDMTREALRAFGVNVLEQDGVFCIPGGQRYISPGSLTLEGDWTAAACWLAAGAMSPAGVFCGPLNRASAQGDRAILDLLRRFGAETEEREDGVMVRGGALRGIGIDAADIPDLVPILAVVGVFAQGDTHICSIARLRYKESDRVASILAMLRALGAEAEAADDMLTVHGGPPLRGGTVDACRDHRIVMAAAIAACACREPVDILGAEAVSKSYPAFFSQLAALGGQWEEIGDGI